MDLPPPQAHTEIVRVYSQQDLCREQYQKYITPFNKILGSILQDLRKNHTEQEAHLMFSQILQLRDDLVDFLNIESAEYALVNKGKK